ncbi:MAG: TspO/MBR family protein [Pseudomonadota bacterium]
MTFVQSLRAPSLWVALAVAFSTGALGGLLTPLGPWYRALEKPVFQPPDWLFGPAWTTIFVLSAYAAHRLWRAAASGKARTLVVTLFVVNIGLNLGWSYLFFFIQRPDLAVFDAVALWLSVLSIMLAVGGLAPISRWLLAPYLGWVAFATVLNVAIVNLNSPFGT